MSSSVLLSDDAPLDPDDELLVAYLDGELDAEAESSLMDRLVDEPELNRRLQQLQDGWDWLDKLPDVMPSERLVESTLELVVADIVKAKPKTESLAARYRWPLGIACACLIACLATLAVDAAVKSISYRQELEELALAENLDAYRHGQDLALMRTLVGDPSWRQMITAMRELGEFLPHSTPRIAETPLGQREHLIANMSLAERQRLAAHWERFVNLDPADKQQIRQTASEVAVQSDAKTLLDTMESYEEWRQTLPTELRRPNGIGRSEDSKEGDQRSDPDHQVKNLEALG